MGLLRGKVALITGASRGIGHTLAIAFAEEGAAVVASARTLRPCSGSPPGSLDETVEKIRRAGGKALAVPCDVTRPEDLRNLAREALESLGQVDILVNNAGVAIHGDILSYKLEWWDTTFLVNVRAPLLLCQAILPDMIKRRTGSIINITSAGATEVRVQGIAYGPSKAAVERFTLNLAEAVRPYGIAVNALSPGRLATEMTRGMPGTEPPEMIVPSALWLAQQTACSFTGRIVHRREFGKSWP